MSGALNVVTADEFSALLNLTPRKIAVAVSGGADSMALAFCAGRWALQNNVACIALIVDHALRADSAAEAEQVRARLEKLGMPVEILRWRHDGIASHIHEQARQARYDLLTTAALRHGATDLLVGHHREDQAETILMRLSKGSGIEGLAGMEARAQRGGITILRPFLSLSKQRLIATCDGAGIDFVTDPSNQSEKYARGRLRKIMPLLQSEGLTIDSLCDLGDRAAEAGAALDHYAKHCLRAAATVEIGGAIRLNRRQLGRAPRAIALRALAACLRYVHNGEHPPERAALTAALDAVLRFDEETARTFYGCILSLAPSDAVILREPAAATEILPFTGAGLLWDKRWHIGGAATLSGEIRALGNPPHETVDALAPDLRHRIPQGRIRATLPALWQGDRLCAIPSFDEKAAFRLSYRKQTFP